MKVIVYKGFNEKFLENIKDEALVATKIEDKINIFKIDDNYEEEIQLSVLQKRNDTGSFWMTYEEFTIAYEYLILRASEGKLDIEIIDNNIYPSMYPVKIKIDDEVYNKYIINKENNEIEEKDEKDEIIEKINKFYSDLLKIDGYFFASYNNYEMQYNSDIRNITKFYNEQIDVENSSECDYLVKIGDDIGDYLGFITSSQFLQSEHIAYTMYCETEVSTMILASLKALLKYNNKCKIYRFIGTYDADESLNNELKNIAENVMKIENFSFRPLSFYKNPSISNEMEEVSQGKIIRAIINEAEKAYNEEVYRDIFITAPTGAGKSLIFQIPSIYLAEKYKKLIIIIEPLKGLMADQQEKFEKFGYKKAKFLNSDIPTPLEREQIVEGVKNGDIDILYISPETLLSHSLETLIGDREIGLVVVDEAHIVTTWGVGFRPDYWYLGSYLNDMRKEKNYKGIQKRFHRFPIFACTATAVNGGKDDTVSDTVLSLYMNDPIIKLGTAKRDNISFEINNYTDKTYDEYKTQKIDMMNKRIKKWISEKDKTIIYFPYKTIAHSMYNGYREFKDFEKYKQYTGVYTGDYELSEVDKNEMMNKFKNNEISVMYATKAFGMGVDIKDIHNVYHYAVTGNLSDYIQEIGRAARKENTEGKAIVDYFNYDLKYMNNLFGMSQIRQYQVKKCLAIIYDTYKNKSNLKFLINPKMFQGVFDNVDNVEELERKLKIVLLMLEKDLYEKYKNRILISRPSSIFTKAYVCLDKNFEEEVLRGKYGKYFKKISAARNREVEKQYFKPENSDVIVSDMGDIFEINLKGIWEDEYSSKMSFAAFKFNFYSKGNDVLADIQDYIAPRVKIKIKTKKDNLNSLSTKAEEEIDYLTKILSTFGRDYFTKDKFKQLIKERYIKESKSEVIANSYFNIIDSKEDCIKRRTMPNGDIKYQVSDGRVRQLAMSILNKSNLMRKLNAIESEEYEQYYNETEKDTNLLKLLSMLDLITYEIEGGNTPEIYIRLNAPDKIKRIVEDKIVYTNNYVERARDRHYRAVKILDYFFRNFENDDDARKEFIERYFLGEDVEEEIDEKISEKTIIKDESIDKYINENGQTYDVSGYENWDNIIKNVIEEEKYKYFCNVLKSNNKRIPDYAYTDIEVNKILIPTLFIYLEEKVIVFPESYKYNALQKCKEKGWNIIPINEIENNLNLIKGE